MAHDSDPQNPLMDALLREGELKTWSVIFTCLVDLCLSDHPHLTGPQLSHVTRRINIRPQAQRTALHRLRSDGLISISRLGRISQIKLSAKGRAAAQTVNTRIYAPAQQAPERLFLLTLRDGTAPPLCTLPVTKTSYLSERPGAPEALTTPIWDDLPAWVMDRLMPPKEAARYARLRGILSGPVPKGLTAPERQTLRTLILHIWRRHHLRQPPLAAQIFESKGDGAACRAAVAAWLAALPRVEPAQLI